MRRAIFVALGTGAFITSAAAISIGAGSTAPSQSLTRQEYEASTAALESARGLALARCESLAGYDRDVCRTETAAAASVRAAEIEEQYRRSQQSARALQRARIDARYQLDRTRCGAMGGFKRDKCLIQAHAARGRAMLDAAAPYEVRF